MTNADPPCVCGPCPRYLTVTPIITIFMIMQISAIARRVSEEEAAKERATKHWNISKQHFTQARSRRFIKAVKEAADVFRKQKDRESCTKSELGRYSSAPMRGRNAQRAPGGSPTGSVRSLRRMNSSDRRKTMQVTGGQSKKGEHEAAFSIYVALSPARTPLRVLKLKLQKDHGIPYYLMKFVKDDQNMNTADGEAVEGWAIDCDRSDGGMGPAHNDYTPMRHAFSIIERRFTNSWVLLS